MNYILLIFYTVFIISVLSFLSLAPWVPTRKQDLERINNVVKLKKWENFLEIWCGTARVSIFIAKHNPESQVIWIELSPFLYLVSKIKVSFSRLNNIEIIYWNALKIYYSKYDVLYVFWLPETLKNKLFSKLKSEMKKWSRFVSYCFKMENDYFIEEKHKKDKQNNIYEYKVVNNE